MPKKMFINATEREESRVAVLDERGLLENLIIETSAKGQIKGNIYKAVIVNVDPGLEAAFIDYGATRHGFLPLSDVQQRYYNSPKEVPPQKAHEYLKKGAELLVQAEREEVMHKGAVFTTFLSLPGRFMVIMPESSGGGISRKIEDENERKTLKETIKVLKNDEDNVAIIIRTAGVGHDDLALKDDYQSLLKEYKNIAQAFQKKKGAGLIYEDIDVTIRSLRDYFSKDIDEVFIDSFPVYKKAIEFFRRFMPEHLKCVKHYREKRPLFARYNVEPQIEQMYDRMSPLPSGGTICIDPTEALISIDVNSGGAKSDEGQEMLAFQTNVEAAVEVARQIRLRNLGGLIVIDFIDMNNPKYRRIVERVIQAAIKKDKARIEISPIGKFGLMEMSRQRIKANFGSISKTVCPSCDGQGFLRATPMAASSALRKISDLALSAGQDGEVRVDASSACASYLLNEKRYLLQKIESENNIRVRININLHLQSGQEAFTVNTRKALEEEEKRDSINKERRERAASKIPTDRIRRLNKTTWKIGDGFIETKDLPLATQEILNEHFYEITNQKPPTVEETISEITENNKNNSFSKNKKNNRRRPEANAEELFTPLPENFTTFELNATAESPAEIYDSFAEITELILPPDEESEKIIPQTALSAEPEIVENVMSQEAPLISSTINLLDESVAHQAEQNKSAEISQITNRFASFEIQEKTVDTTITTSFEVSESILTTKSKEEKLSAEKPITFEGIQILDITHTAKNFGLGLDSQLSTVGSVLSQEPKPILEGNIIDNPIKENEENSTAESNEDSLESSEQPEDNYSKNLYKKNRPFKDKRSFRPFNRKKFKGNRNNGGFKPPHNNDF